MHTYLKLNKKIKKYIFYLKYIKKNNISLLEKKKISNIYINLHFLVINFKFEYYDEYFFKYNFYYFSIKKFFNEKNIKQLFNSKYFKYVKESNFFQFIFFFKEEILIENFFFDSKIYLNFFNFNFNFFIFNFFYFDLSIIFTKKILKNFKTFIKKDIKNRIKLIKKLKIKDLKKKKFKKKNFNKKNLILEINEKIILIKKLELLEIKKYDEEFFELYIDIKIELKNIENIDLKKKINIQINNIFKYYKNIDNLLNSIQKKIIFNTFNKNYWNDLTNNEKLSLINIEPKNYLILKKKNKINSFYLKVCQEIDITDALKNNEKNIYMYNNFFENNKIETFIKMAEKHLDSEIFAKKEIDYILYNCFNFSKSTLVFKVEKKKKIFLEPKIDIVIKNEIKKNIITSNKVIVEYNLDVLVWDYFFIKNFKNLIIDNFISIEMNIYIYFDLNSDYQDNNIFNLKNDLINHFFLLNNKKKLNNFFFLFKLDYIFNIKKQKIIFKDFLFNKELIFY